MSLNPPNPIFFVNSSKESVGFRVVGRKKLSDYMLFHKLTSVLTRDIASIILAKSKPSMKYVSFLFIESENIKGLL